MQQMQALKEKKTWHVSSTVISNANASVDACKKMKTLRFLAFSLALAFAIVFHTCEPFKGKGNRKRKVRKVCRPCWNGEFSIVGTNHRTKLAFVLVVWTFFCFVWSSPNGTVSWDWEKPWIELAASKTSQKYCLKYFKNAQAARFTMWQWSVTCVIARQTYVLILKRQL